MALKETTERVRKKVQDLVSDMKDTRRSLRETVKDLRPKPVRGLVERRVEPLRPLKRRKDES